MLRWPLLVLRWKSSVLGSYRRPCLSLRQHYPSAAILSTSTGPRRTDRVSICSFPCGLEVSGQSRACFSLPGASPRSIPFSVSTAVGSIFPRTAHWESKRRHRSICGPSIVPLGHGAFRRLCRRRSTRTRATPSIPSQPTARWSLARGEAVSGASTRHAPSTAGGAIQRC